MTTIDIGQFPKIDSEPQDFKLKWYKTKLFPFRYSEGIHYFIQKGQRQIIDEIDKWIKEIYFKEEFPLIIDWKLKINSNHSATLTCENRYNADFKFSFITVFPYTDIELFYDGNSINEVNFCLFDIAGSKTELMLEIEWVYLLSIASRLFT
jgi:hypothetical protein